LIHAASIGPEIFSGLSVLFPTPTVSLLHNVSIIIMITLLSNNLNNISCQIKFPQEEDLSGAATAILRLQDVYRLDTTDLSNGIIMGDKVAHKLSAHDSFEVGRAAYNERDYYHTLTWMQAAMNKLENENPKTIDEAEVLEYLAYALYQQGNVRRALALTRRLAAIAPNHPRARGNVKWYEDMLNGKDMEGELPPVVNRRVENDGIVERDAYEALCRGETVAIPPEVEKKLYCYLKMDKQFLKLAPIKVEILRLEPLAVLFKEVMSDYEMEVIKAVATPKLRRATVQNAVTGALETASYRISKSAWLKEGDHPVIARVNKRIHDMTNLNQDTSEDLQVANYGLGGHYDPHFDFAQVSFLAGRCSWVSDCDVQRGIHPLVWSLRLRVSLTFASGSLAKSKPIPRSTIVLVSKWHGGKFPCDAQGLRLPVVVKTWGRLWPG
uniref:P4Hc domain-containing protein n=1 Tax=Angiostrongylus cantonensis TaxID=6313 RepID=A0A0K0DP84_ANGCA